MAERCPICDQCECLHTEDEKELVKLRAEVSVLDGAIEGWRSHCESQEAELEKRNKALLKLEALLKDIRTEAKRCFDEDNEGFMKAKPGEGTLGWWSRHIQTFAWMYQGIDAIMGGKERGE